MHIPVGDDIVNPSFKRNT